MYNMLHGVNPFSKILLEILNLKMEDIGRFRDAYVKKENEKWIICIYTRLGGGNRECFCDEPDDGAVKQFCGDCYQHSNIVPLQSHPQYIIDYDDDFDCTYATFEFNVPEKHIEIVEILHSLHDKKEPSQRWNELFEKLKSKDDDPEVTEILLKFKPILDEIVKLSEEKQNGK